MNKTITQNFFEIMEIAQKYHNANMSHQEIDESTTDKDALRVLELCREIRRDNGEIGNDAVNESLDAKDWLIQDIAEGVIAQVAVEYPAAEHLALNYSAIGADYSEEFDKYAREYASTAL